MVLHLSTLNESDYVSNHSHTQTQKYKSTYTPPVVCVVRQASMQTILFTRLDYFTSSTNFLRSLPSPPTLLCYEIPVFIFVSVVSLIFILCCSTTAPFTIIDKRRHHTHTRPHQHFYFAPVGPSPPLEMIYSVFTSVFLFDLRCACVFVCMFVLNEFCCLSCDMFTVTCLLLLLLIFFLVVSTLLQTSDSSFSFLCF